MNILKNTRIIPKRLIVKTKVVPSDIIIDNTTILPKYFDMITNYVCKSCLEYIPPPEQQELILQKMHIIHMQTDIKDLEKVFLELFLQKKDKVAIELLENVIDYNISIDNIRQIINSES